MPTFQNINFDANGHLAGLDGKFRSNDPLGLQGGTTLLFSNSFNDTDYPTAGDENDYGVLGNFTFGGGSGASNTNDLTGIYTEVLADAKNPDSPGHFGWRQHISDLSDNRFTDPHRYTPTSPLTEFWARFYIRYENGFTWGASGPPYHKWFDCRTASQFIIIEPTTVLSGGDFSVETSGGTDARDNTFNWTDFFGVTSTGTWHMVNIHFKMDTDQTDGEAQIWVDNTLVLNVTGHDFSGGNAELQAGITVIEVFQNQRAPTHIGIKYVDGDDLAITDVEPNTIEPISGLPWIGPV